MDLQSFLNLYQQDGVVRAIAEYAKDPENLHLQLKGCSGSLDAVLAAAITAQIDKAHLFVLNDKEEAAYFHNDLQNLLPRQEVLLFPTSYKKPYQFEEIENANVLMRAEILNRMSQSAKPTNRYLSGSVN